MSEQRFDTAFAQDVHEGLTGTPKKIPAKWLYDEQGSRLFEEITKQPEYYLTDKERSIFQDHAHEILDACQPPVSLVELGAGSADKTRKILDALIQRQGHATYWPVDISQEALEMAQARFQDTDGVRVHPVQATYAAALDEATDPREKARLIAFIGSSIGNMTPPAQRRLLSNLQDAMTPDDRLLLGTDLLKDESILLPAYDDEAGVTARFTLNLFRRINRELDADFDLDALAHRPTFDPDKNAIVTYAESLQDQTITLQDLEATLHLDEGDRIHIEDSYKYTPEMIQRLADDARLTRLETFTDPDDWFAVHVLAPI